MSRKVAAARGARRQVVPMELFGLSVPIPSTYLLVLTIAGFVNTCVALAVPAWRRPASAVAVALMAGNVLSPDLATGFRVAAAALTPVLAFACVLQLRRPVAC
jgi:hypothetical protein